MAIINGRGRVGIRKPSAAATPSIILDGLKLYLDAGNAASYAGTGTTWTDLSGNGNTGTLTGANGLPTYSSANGGSITFDGTDDYVSIPDINITNQLSVEAWVYANSVGSYNSIVAQWRADTNSVSSWTLETVGSDVRLYITNGTTLSFASTNFQTGVWIHVVGTYDNSVIKIYKNSVLGVTTGTLANMNNSNLNINIGAMYSLAGVQGGGARWNGRISSIKIYNRALSASEVLQNYNAALSRFYPVVSDSNAQAFVVAAGLTSSVQANAVNTLVTSLKAAGIWTKMKAVYPFVGGSAASHKWNLKDPRDLDAAYRLAFTVGVTHASTGINGNGTGYANTNFNPFSAGITKTDFGITAYSRTNSSNNGTLIGLIRTSPTSYIEIRPRTTGNYELMTVYGDSYEYGTYLSNSLGLFTAVRTGTTQVFYQNGVQKSQRTAYAATSDINGNIYLCARNFIGYSPDQYSNREIAFTAIHDSLSGAEALSFYNAVQAYQTSLGRQV